MPTAGVSKGDVGAVLGAIQGDGGDVLSTTVAGVGEEVLQLLLGQTWRVQQVADQHCVGHGYRLHMQLLACEAVSH